MSNTPQPANPPRCDCAVLLIDPESVRLGQCFGCRAGSPPPADAAPKREACDA